MTIPLALALGAFFSLGGLSQTGSGIPFTPAGIRAIIGKNICEFQGEFANRFGLYLGDTAQHSVDYRERDGVSAVFLLSQSTPRCGVVDAAIDLTPLIHKGESVEFKCYIGREGGAVPGKWGHIIGLASNREGNQRFVKARLAWRVDIDQKRFEEMRGESAVCDTSGYTN